ncbi:M1 family metallopeptidase [Marinirhabdus gelatinilytica]|uniref:Aminopeptidase N n=1 Tax=Marinirhabdus gelatinilytica TaxID=1703343 RepID=A0A370QFL2_9FLAO|nr:M1 family aminopeptidase [Marinirhabdus gelatinilytica]RDK87155.1 aminopeptidase N [Marinirhabdus gelatinilytica]
MKYIFAFLLATTFCFSQQTENVDFQKISATVQPLTATESVKGSLTVTFQTKKRTDSVFLDAINMKLITTDLEVGTISATQDKIWFTGKFQPNSTYTASFDYEATPKQTLYFTGDQIWTQGQGKYTSHWLPSIDDMNDKIEFDLSFVIPFNNNRVIANGERRSVKVVDGAQLFQYDMKNPMASYLVAFAVGNFQKMEVASKSGVPIDLHIATKDTANFEPTYRYTKEIFDFLEEEIGVPYPWQNYKQVPVRDFLYAGMENTTCTIFSEAFVVDQIGFNDRNYVNVNAHELAHQWFGNLVTETSGTHHWLHEGFATYYALLAEREIFGDDYYYWKLYQSAEQLKALSDDGKGQSLLDPKASSLIFYEKGAWALHILKEQIGEEAFKNAVGAYLKRFKFKNVSTQDFLDQVKAVTTTDISTWEKDWLQQTAFKAEQAYNSLMKSPFMQDYFEVSRLATLPLEDKKIPLTTALTFPNDFIGQEAVYQLANEPVMKALPLYVKAFESNNLYVRQAIALSVESVPEPLKPYFESLLDDASYVTQEAALYLLCINFPENVAQYLQKMEGVQGFQDKSIRQLWLALAILASDYNVPEKEKFKEELRGYTSEEFSFEVRQKAFEYVHQLGLYNDRVLRNLINASVHHNWRFRKFARTLFSEKIKDPATSETISKAMGTFSAKEQSFLKNYPE